MILKTTVLTRFTVWHWTLVGAAACGVIVFFLVEDYPPSNLLMAQTSVKDPSTGAVMASPRQSISLLHPEQDPKIVEQLKQAPEFTMNIENKLACPLIITNATMRWLERFGKGGEVGSFAVQFRFELSNTTNRRAKSFVASPFLPARDKLPSEGKIFMILGRAIEPLGKLEMPMEAPLVLTERPESLTIRIEGVEFEDGTSWGNVGNPRSIGTQTIPGPSRVRVGGAVQSANLISQVKAIYPPLAKQARIQGEVVLEAVISREGDVTNLRVVSGHPLLLDAALTAARQWKYKPTLLNGQPVEVVSQVTVPFTLDTAN